MLVLTRKENETIILELPTGDIIKVTVCEISGTAVRIGIDAADDILILRDDLLD